MILMIKIKVQNEFQGSQDPKEPINENASNILEVSKERYYCRGENEDIKKEFKIINEFAD